MSSSHFKVIAVRNSEDLAATTTLFNSYVASLGINLDYQDYASEIAKMPGKYSPTVDGELLLARRDDGIAIGCVGLRALGNDGVCEMKRLYVTPDGRGLGVGRALVRAVVAIAEELGYKEMRLDSLPHMVAARKLYEEIGFYRIEKYYDTPVEETVFMAVKLDPTRQYNEKKT